MRIRHKIAVFSAIIFITLGFFPPFLLALSTTPYNVGLTTMDFDYVNIHGKKEIITAAVWYPTEEEPHLYTYHTARDYESKVAFNASAVAKGGPYPLLLFIHGGFGSGYDSAYLTEYLARHGYIVVAPDYVDTRPPEYTEPIAFSTIKGGKQTPAITVFKVAEEWIQDMNANREFFLSYLAEHRFYHTSYLIDKMLDLNADSRSMFYHAIQADAIGMIGYSEGGVTTLGKIGTHPDAQMRDEIEVLSCWWLVA